MGRLLYDIGIFGYSFGVKTASLFNEKARLWIDGRRKWRKRVESSVQELDPGRETVWFHVSSLGEFEQGRPLMEELKRDKEINLILSFYSPSGFEIMKNWSGADLIIYLPLDTEKNATDFIRLIDPSLAIFVKYDFWYHYLKALKKKEIPCLLISARFYPDQLFFKKWAKWYRSILFLFDKILVQDQLSMDLLASVSYDNALLTGDTRYDRVWELSQHNDRFPEIEKFIDGRRLFIAGSSWPLDEKIMLPYIRKNKKNMCFIIAPHDIRTAHVLSLKNKLDGKVMLFSEWNSSSQEEVLILNSIGMLSRLYKYAYVAYIGGAFKEGLHNILEPAAFGVPVITGPDHKGFLEGPLMEEEGALFRVSNEEEFAEIMDRLIGDADFRNKASEKARNFIQHHTGASEKTLAHVEEYLAKI
jgi:3-deoxy-D-manno-octulosonic-acid transferase